jgi:hypothetical protein
MDVTWNYKAIQLEEQWLNIEKLDAYKQVRNVLASDGALTAWPIVETDNIIVYINGKQYRINVLPI